MIIKCWIPYETGKVTSMEKNSGNIQFGKGKGEIWVSWCDKFIHEKSFVNENINKT